MYHHSAQRNKNMLTLGKIYGQLSSLKQSLKQMLDEEFSNHPRSLIRNNLQTNPSHSSP